MNEPFSLGDAEQHKRKLSGVKREQHERIVNAGLSKFSAVKAAGSPTDSDLLMSKFQDIQHKIFEQMKPIIEEAKKQGIHDYKACKEMFAALMLQQLDTRCDKDELVFLLTALITEEFMNAL